MLNFSNESFQMKQPYQYRPASPYLDNKIDIEMNGESLLDQELLAISEKLSEVSFSCASN